MVDSSRTRSLNKCSAGSGPVVYWMSREQRLKDNWALLYAAERAHARNVPLLVLFALSNTFPEATMRSYGFLLKGLEELSLAAKEKGIPFFLEEGDPCKTVPVFLERVHAGEVVCDMNPLRVPRGWRVSVAKKISIPLVEVDAHNIVPVWRASEKLEFAARTIRPKIHRLLPEYLVAYPPLRLPKAVWTKSIPAIHWNKVRERLDVDRSVPEVDGYASGETAAHAALKDFLKHRLAGYAIARNNPNNDGQSNLSPYLHFGQLSPQRVALEVKSSGAPTADCDVFLEELIVRRELSDNYCFYNSSYDSFEGFPAWAKKTLMEHTDDPREYTYTKKQFEEGKTHDPLWNAAQSEMVQTGKMHGYVRMYWAKKILEWSKSPEEAMKIAVYLNDRYELDGRDPNGYVGCAWSIGGVHDRPWFNRAVFGSIRFMSEGGMRKKFDVAAYTAKCS